MRFERALQYMQQGTPVKLPSWGGYWYWNDEKQTVIMHTKDGIEMDIRETNRVEYTLKNILSDEWIVASSSNCPQLGGTALFSFGEALKYLNRGLKVCRTGWNGKGMYLFMSPPMGCQMYEQFTGKPINDIASFIVVSTVHETLVPWVASQTDILANDWMFVE